MFLTFCKCEEVVLPRTYRTSSHLATQASLRTVSIRYLLLKVHFKISDNRLVSTVSRRERGRYFVVTSQPWCCIKYKSLL